MRHTRRTDNGQVNQPTSEEHQENPSQSEMLRQLVGWTQTVEERFRRLEEGRAGEGPNGGGNNNRNHLNDESEGSDEPVLPPTISQSNTPTEQRPTPNMAQV